MTNRTDTEGGAMTLEKGLAAFLDAMLGRNRSQATLRAYRTDVRQFMTFLHENNVAITGVGDVGKVDVLEYLAALARKGLTGVARARKVSAIREYFRFLELGFYHLSSFRCSDLGCWVYYENTLPSPSRSEHRPSIPCGGSRA